MGNICGAPEGTAPATILISSVARPKDFKVKMVLVGDTSVGKSSLITNYLSNQFNEEHEPTVLDVYKGTKAVQKRQIELEIHDTTGDPELNNSHPLQYNNADVFMVCTSAVDTNSFNNIQKWIVNIRMIHDDRPIILCLTKKDLLQGEVEPDYLVT